MKFLGLSRESRSAYRVPVAGTHSTLWIGLPRGPLEVRLDNISSRGCGFTVDLDSAASLEEGAELVLRMKAGERTSPQLFIRSEIRAIRVESEGVRVGVQFKERDRLYQQLDVSQWLYFNRRGAFRVPPVQSPRRPATSELLRPQVDPGAASNGPRSLLVRDVGSAHRWKGVRTLQNRVATHVL